MIRKTKWHKVSAKVIASALAAATGLSSFSGIAPGSVAYAETDEEKEAAYETSASSEKSSDGAKAASTESSLDESDEGSSENSTEVSDASSDSAALDDSKEAEETDQKSDQEELANKLATSDSEDTTADRNFDESKTDVWDFGAEDLGSNYNNRLDVATINSFYSVEAGTKGVNIASFSVDNGDFVFEDGGYSTTHRLRTTNPALSRYDEKSLKDSDGNVYSGYIYSNKSATDAVYVALECQADDIITAYVASNGTDSEVHFRNVEDASDDAFFVHKNGGSTVTKMVFYPANTAQYKLFSASEKLVLARVLREHAKYSDLTGEVEGFEGTGSFDIVFTNKANGNVVKATVADGKYTARLAQGFDYELSLEGADEYVITSDKTVNISEDTQKNITVEGISLVDVTGKITGIDEDDLAEFAAAADFSFVPQDENSVFVPQIKLSLAEDAIEYQVRLQKNVEYAVSVEDKEGAAFVENYDLLTTKLTAESDKEAAIELEAKPVYDVTIVPSGATKADLSEAVFTFTRLDTENDFAKDGYVYEFTGTEGIALRNGQYKVEVSNSGSYVQKLTSDLIVKGEAVSKEIAFSSDITEWDFADASFVSKFANATEGTYNGLSWTNGRSHNGVYLYSGAGTISVPVKGDCQIQVTGNYQYSYYFENENEASVGVKTGTTSSNETYTYDYKGGAGYVDITVLGSSYLTKIAAVYQTEYKSELTVGADKEYKTIGDALAAVRLMDRKDGERVTIKVQPGNYEEMLVIDVPNVTLENASNSPSNSLTNSGVDIDENAVRVTWYYGHGYTYYSMNSAYKYDAEALAANKANGYTEVINPGSGTATYWNASVVVGAAGFEAKNIIFENSFNQYMSEKAAEDVIVPQSGAKEGTVKRASMKAFDTTVQDKKYVERAAALALTKSATETYFENCRFIGRQDTLYGADNATAAFYNCAVYGGTDYIFGGMTAVFAKCDLVLNTSEDKNDVAYITAAQQASSAQRGYLMYNCTVKSTTPGVDSASKYVSKPGQFGRPWKANTSEVVFFDTVVEATNWKDGAYDESAKTSLIQPAGWNTSLGGESARNVEYGTYEVSGENNSAKRVTWVQQPQTAVLADGTAISVAAFLGDWDPFAANGKDMSITFPDGSSQDEPVAPTPSEGPGETEGPVTYVLETAGMATFSAGAKADGEAEKAGTDDFYTIIYSAKTKVDTSSKTWDDGYTSGVRINWGGAGSTEKNAVKFTTSSDNATVKVWWVCGGDNRPMAILDASGAEVSNSGAGAVKNSLYISSFELEKAGTYYLIPSGGSNYFFKAEVTDGAAAVVEERADWSSVAAPVVSEVKLNSSDAGKIDVTVQGAVGFDGGDKLVVTMFDAEGKEISSANSLAEGESCTKSFAPTKTGEYTFMASLSRDDEEEVKKSAMTEAFSFVLPLATPAFKNAVNKGNGTVVVKFYSVPEATSYSLLAIDKTDSASMAKATVTPEAAVDNDTTEYSYTFTNLNIGHEYEISLVANRGDDVSKAATLSVDITEESEREWVFAAFGSGVTKGSHTGYSVNDDGSVTVWNTSNKGKIVPGSTDGLAFYYTPIPAGKNFTLTATATIDTWAFTNGQEGFGLMAADRVGVNGNGSAFWNNSYMASGTKVEYYYDADKQDATEDVTPDKITMKLGLGAQEKVGVTTENLPLLEAGDTATINEAFSSHMYPLEISCGPQGTGTYNLFAKETAGTAKGTIENPITTVTLRIQKNNTGFFVSYLDENGNVIRTKKFYDTEALSAIDSDNIYVGFFASRTFKATFSNIELTVIDPSEDAPAEEKPVTYVAPNYQIVSATYSNTAKYELQYSGNADGILTVKDASGKALIDAQEVKAGVVTSAVTKLTKGDNAFTVTFTPNADFLPDNDDHKRLSSYETAEFEHVVRYATINDDEKIYVTPAGKADAQGTEADPVDIYTAVKYVQPGQTIVLAAGTYSLKSTVKVERGIDGTPSKPIKLVADGGRAVFDFNSACAGFIFAGDYWYVKGIDCTKSGNSLKGIQVSGSHITLEDIRAYENGNTGIQISRYLATDARDEWPSYDLILNCTSYSNADAGYEDADGFAAKLTCGDGIVFDGCISYNNADDGWDLFAKVESGPIGQVTIKNCVAFANGYGVDGKDEGNGNGFKMGGSSISGPHKLINSVAWGNKAKGIDSNSGPDIQVFNSMSFNNGSNNVALYTNDTANTNYYVDGVLSYRTTGTGTNENIKAKGTQDKNNIYGKLNFFWNDGESANSEGLKVSDDWFVSLEAPYANASEPYAVAASLRTSDGRISLGDFLKLTDTGVSALAAAGIDAGDVVACLNGSYEAVKDERDIDGSSENAAKDAEEEEPVEPEIKGNFVTKWGKTTFVTEDGQTLTGLNKINGNLYFFKANGSMVKSNYVTVDEYTYYMDAEGKAVTGFMTKWSNKYYFDENYHQVKNSFFDVDGHTYYAKANGGIVRQDWITVGDNKYYAKGDYTLAKNETITKWGKKYTFDENGILVK